MTANVLHPGVVATSFGHNNPGFFRVALKLLQRFTGLTPEQGADTIIYLASSPEVEGVTGKYWVKRKAIPSSTASYNVETAKRLWEVSEALVNAVPQAQV